MSKWRNFVHLSVLTRWEIKSTKMNEREWILLCTSIDCVRPSSFHMHHGYQYDRIEPAMNWQWMKMMRLRLNYTHLNTWWQSRQQQKCLFYFALFFQFTKNGSKAEIKCKRRMQDKAHTREMENKKKTLISVRLKWWCGIYVFWAIGQALQFIRFVYCGHFLCALCAMYTESMPTQYTYSWLDDRRGPHTSLRTMRIKLHRVTVPFHVHYGR